ncbi:MAG: hypothetical protein JSV49_02290 [Thermoplasmata archaeon]|nr:MAG: hypothetical protein JSV49_02290 [Thermoplasmata archaeon]
MILISVALASGCLKDPEEGGHDYSSIPEVIVDYDFDSEQFKIYVKSAIGDYKYETIKIKVNDYEKIENNTYMLSYNCNSTEYDLDVEAQVDINLVYSYACEIILLNDEENDIFLNVIEIIDDAEKETPVGEDDLPWKKILIQKS